jgi:RHS repeat-associated protein
LKLASWIRVAFASAALVASSVFACGPSTGGPTCAATGVASGARANEVDVGAGNPINLITGNKYQREVDMAPLPGELGLEVIRHYNSSHSGRRAPLGLLGRGWRLSYETRLTETADNIQIIQGDGTLAVFPRTPTQAKLCSAVNPVDGKVTIEGDGRTRHYLWHWMNGRVLRFDGEGRLVSIRASSGAAVLLWYDASGKLSRVVDPQGRELTFEYGRTGAPGFHGIVAIHTPVGRIAYDHPAPDRQSAEPNLHAGDLVGVRYPVSSTGVESRRIYHFEDKRFPTLLTGISVVEAGNEPKRHSTYEYDAEGKAVMSMLARGINKISVDRARDGTLVLTNSLGQKTVYKHALIGSEHRLLHVKGMGCSTCGETNVRYDYDRLARLVGKTSLTPDGLPIESVRIERDQFGRVTGQWQRSYASGKATAEEMVEKVEYQGESSRIVARSIPSVIPGRLARTYITYNLYGQPEKIVEEGWSPSADRQEPVKLERVTRLHYRLLAGVSLLERIDGPLPGAADATVFRYDGNSRLVSAVTSPGVAVVKVTGRDKGLRPTRITLPDGGILEFEFDRLGQIGKAIKAGLEDRYEHDMFGRLTRTRRPDGQEMRFAYRADGRVSDVYDAQNNRIRIERDAEGWIRSRSLLSPDGRIVQVASQAQLTPDLDSHGVSIPRREAGSPDADSYLLALIDPVGNTTRIVSDRLHRVKAVIDARNNRTRFWFDDFGRIVVAESPDAGTTVYQWNEGNQLIKKTNGFGTAGAKSQTYRYDAAGRVVEQANADGRTLVDYGPSGKPVRIRFPSGEERFQYDEAGRLTMHARSFDGLQFSTSYRFDNLGRLQQKILPDGQVLDYVYNSQVHAKPGLLSSITRRDLSGRTVILAGLNAAGSTFSQQQYFLANGVAYSRALDIQGHLVRIGSPGVWEEAHHRGNEGFLIGRRLLVAGAFNDVQYAYDENGRMVSAAHSSDSRGAARFGFDPAGNLIYRELGTKKTRYEFDTASNRLQLADHDGVREPYRYGPTGTVEGAGETEYTWDSQDRLAKVSRAGKTIAEYAYNAFGLRVRKISYAGGQRQVTHYLYEGKELVGEVEVRSGQGHISRQYVWLEDQHGVRPIALLQSRQGGFRWNVGRLLKVIPSVATRSLGQAEQTEVFAIVADHTGAPRALVDSQGRRVWSAEVVDFGRMRILAGQAFQVNLRGSNQYFDAETGLHYNFRRYLDPVVGRYLSPDPTGMLDGANLYAFAYGNPLSFVDPLGLQSKPAGAVSTWSLEKKLKYVFERVADAYPGELGDALRELVSPTALATTAGIFGVWSAAQFTPYGWAADVAMLGVGYLFLGKAIVDVTVSLFKTSKLIATAKCEEDLQLASDVLAKGFGAATMAVGGGGAALGAGKVAQVVRAVFSNSQAANKAATVAAISRSWFGEFVPGRVRSGVVANAELKAVRPDAYSPWLSSRSVTDKWLEPGTKIYMVNLRNASGPGGWATSMKFKSMEEARRHLALLEEFKASGPNCCILQEYIVKSPVPVREGFAGPITSRVPPYDSYPGGAPQWELLLDKTLVEKNRWENFLEIGQPPVVLK